jgi:hypothetical protein
MAPEQILGRPVDEKTDIYIMGGTLYELLTGRPPFQGLSQFEIDSAHVRESPKLPTEFIVNIPPAAVDAIMKALAKEPSDRFATAEEFIQALPDLQGVPYVAPFNDDDLTRVRAAPPEDATQLRPMEATSPNVRRVVTTVAAAGLLGLMVTGVLLLWAWPRARVVAAHPTVAGPSELASHRTEPASQPAGPVSHAAEPAPRPTEPIPQQTEAIPPPPAPIHDLTGTWSGTYADTSGKPHLRLQNLQLQQLTNGAVTGRFNLESGEQCTLEKSTYSADSKHLRLITHCHTPDHPKYLNVPLEFNNVDPTAKTIEGGRLDFHLADDIVVTLERAPGG